MWDRVFIYSRTDQQFGFNGRYVFGRLLYGIIKLIVV